MKNWMVLLTVVLFFTGCAHVISEESRNLVDPTIQFQSLRANPDSFVGKYVMLGGTIAGVKNDEDGSRLEIVQSPLESNELPEEISHSSGGRFLAISSGFLDPMVYKSGRRVTLVGRVLGKKTLPIDRIEYTYPVLAIREIHVWSKSEINPPQYPPPRYYYDPFWWGPPYYWWYRHPYYW
ncbi:MAG TPA: Slp family lipoprotein [Geobacteraceae bacterium]|nr:Slp family lipoprotein [Geobacteraceae bacterium]